MNWTGSRQRQRFQSKKVFLLNPVRVRRFSSTSSFSRRNKLTHSMKGHASSLTLSNHFSSSKQTFHRLPVFEPGFDKTSSAIKCLRKSMFITFPDLGKVTLVSVELLGAQPWSGHEQTKGKECSLGFSRHLWGRTIAWRAQRMSA